jgi:hypothetical protein
MSDTLRLALPRIDAAQSQKHVTHNEALALIDACVHLSVVDRNRLAPPANQVEGSRYLLGAQPTGAFAGHGGAVASYEDGAWRFLAPRTGWRAYVESESRLLVFDGTAWRSVAPDVTALQNAQFVGLGTTADAGNPLAAKLNATLFTALQTTEGGTGDLRFKLNKQQTTGIVSQLYQSNYSGRAETGLMGDDRYRIKVSVDGAAWKEAMTVDPSSGRVFFPNGSTDQVAAAMTTTGTPAAFQLAASMAGPMPEGCIFWMVPHAPNATALNVDPTLQVIGVDAAPVSLKSFDGGALPQGALEANRATLVRKVGATYCIQTRRSPHSFVNLLEDGGRFCGVPELLGNVATTFTDGPYIGVQNGAVRASFGVARANSSSFGGAGAAMLPQVAELVSKIRSGASLLTGSEFFVSQTTSGNGLTGGVTVQGASYYMPLSATRQTGKGQTTALYFRVVSGSLIIGPSDACPRVLVDGVNYDHTVDSPDRVFTAAHGWRHMQRWVSTPDGYLSNYWPLRTTPGTVFLMALPAVVPGLETLPWDIGPVPSMRLWR